MAIIDFLCEEGGMYADDIVKKTHFEYKRVRNICETLESHHILEDVKKGDNKAGSRSRNKENKINYYVFSKYLGKILDERFNQLAK